MFPRARCRVRRCLAACHPDTKCWPAATTRDAPRRRHTWRLRRRPARWRAARPRQLSTGARPATRPQRVARPRQAAGPRRAARLRGFTACRPTTTCQAWQRRGGLGAAQRLSTCCPTTTMRRRARTSHPDHYESSGHDLPGHNNKPPGHRATVRCPATLATMCRRASTMSRWAATRRSPTCFRVTRRASRPRPAAQPSPAARPRANGRGTRRFRGRGLVHGKGRKRDPRRAAYGSGEVAGARSPPDAVARGGEGRRKGGGPTTIQIA